MPLETIVLGYSSDVDHLRAGVRLLVVVRESD
jgi:hypothetical protein